MLTEVEQEKLLEQEAQEAHWIAVSDLMSGLMMVFLLIAIIYMVRVEIETRKIREVAVLYNKLRDQLYNDLYNEFKYDLPRWGAELNRDLSLRFYNTEVLFGTGESNISYEFETILGEFFPRYIKIITSDKYRFDITEVRIEGHTSSGWQHAVDYDEAYINNMGLSQRRTRSSLAYVMELADVQHEKEWIKDHLTANGLSSSKPVIDQDGFEDEARSRRVEFRLRTDAESRIAAILDLKSF